MILNYIADGTCFIIKSAATLDTKVFGHGDLHALDKVAVPERLHEGVRKAENEHVMHRPLPEVMIDPEDLGLIEGSQQYVIELPRRNEVASKGLFNTDASPLGAPRC